MCYNITMDKEFLNNLPPAFGQRMQSMLREEYPDFLECYDSNNFTSLRINTLKTSVEQGVQKLQKLGGLMGNVDWCDSGFYYDKAVRYGKHPYHEAGLYYIQEASAMSVVESIGIAEGDYVLDLCSAPGGKATHIACKLGGTGLLVANEYVPSRSKILSQNIERMGISNCIVTNNSPQELEDNWQEFFDKIVVDAPCSGEGMFRKTAQAAEEWSEQNVEMCATRQLAILDSAYKMLKAGGKMVYSTCTFSVQENEQVVEEFLARHSDMKIAHSLRQFCPARVQWTKNGLDDIVLAQRLFPHHIKGEGHFVCVLQKGEEGNDFRTAKQAKPNKNMLKIYEEWAKQNLNISLTPNICFGDNLYYLDATIPNLDKVKVLRCGLHLGQIKKDRFEPSHSLAMYLHPAQAKRVIDLPCDSKEIFDYFQGNAIDTDSKGWCLVCVDGLSCGWSKADGYMAKNHYPKGLRRDIRL